MPTISVLIPAYNVETFLPKCLDSVLSQTFKNYEVILIDDGSTDGTGEICDRYATKDLRIKVFHQENRGISAARNSCLQYASGDYIQFVDSDDWIEPNMLEILFNCAVECDADFVGCSFFDEQKDFTKVVCTYYDGKEEFLEDVLQNRWGVLWKLLIKRDIVTKYNISFPQGINGGEDFVFVTKGLFYAQKVVCVKDALYHYNRLNMTSFITEPSYEKNLNQYEATELVIDFLKKEKKDFRISLLNRRKVAVKSSLMKCSFFKSYRLYSDVDLWALKHVPGKKNKCFFFFAFLMNLLAKPKCILGRVS